MNSFQDKVVVVTGGGSGIGRSTCLLLARQGAKVAVVYSHSKAEADETTTLINESGGLAVSYCADISRSAAVDAMISAVAKEFGRIDYLVNNAGITRQLSFSDLEVITNEIWDQIFDVNVKGTFNCCKAAAPYLKKNAGSAIVNVGSVAGHTGYGSSLPYAVSKSAVHGLTKSLARVLAPHVRVNCIAPGAVDTRWWKNNEDKMHQLAGKILMQRVSSPEDIAETIAMLLTAQSMTGQIVLAENGQTL